MKKCILCFLLLLSSSIHAQEIVVDSDIRAYEIALKKGDYVKAMKRVDASMDRFIKKGTQSDTQFANLLKLKANLYTLQEQFEQALPLYQESLQITEKLLGEEHELVGKALNNVGTAYLDLEQYSLALASYDRSRSILIKTLGKEHLELARNYDHSALAMAMLGKFAEALPMQEIALALFIQLEGNEHIEVARCMDNLAQLYVDLGQFDQALTFEEKALQGFRQIQDAASPDIAMCLNNLAHIYSQTGDYSKALPLNREALAIYRKNFGSEHPDVAMSLNNLGTLHSRMGNYEMALPLQEEALAIYQQDLGDTHPMVAICLNNLAQLHSIMGHNNKALPLYERSLSIWKNSPDVSVSDIAMGMNNISMLHFKMGQHDQAFKLSEAALVLFKENLGPDHPDVALGLNNLAYLYSETQQYEKALPFYLEALSIYTKALVPNPLDVAMAHDNLAILYSNLGNFTQAFSMNEKALEIYSQNLNKDHPDLLACQFNLAQLYAVVGKYDRAISIHEDVLATRLKVLGEFHPEVEGSYTNLSLLYSQSGNYPKSILMLEESIRISSNQLLFNFSVLSENQKFNYLDQKTNNLSQLYSFATNHSVDLPSSKTLALNKYLFINSIALRNGQKLRASVEASKNPDLKNYFNQWKELKRQSTNIPVATLNNQDTTDLSETEDSLVFLERMLTKLSGEFAYEKKLESIDYNKIKKALKPDDAFLIFNHFRYFNGISLTDSVIYTVHIVKPEQEEPEMLLLFEEKQLLSILQAPDLKSLMANVYQSTDSQLYQLIWAPISKYIGTGNRVYLSLSGQLHKLAFAAMGDGTGNVLGNRYELHQVLHVHDLVLSLTTSSSSLKTKNGIAIFGGINYDGFETEKVLNTKPINESNPSRPSGINKGHVFNYLPGTQRELETLKKLFDNTSYRVRIFEGDDAREKHFSALEGKNAPSILHIATHGYFSPLPDSKQNKRMYELGGTKNQFNTNNNPMLRSGLILAGGNAAWQGKGNYSAQDDGILTALEVSNYNFTQTKLVVLSACESGLGDINGTEGVLGLQRAFRLSGVAYQLISLWRIPDKETTEYMHYFYTAFLASNNIPSAFYAAQKLMQKKYQDDPLKWAGLVLIE